jgi:hypothetical protein
MPLGDGVNDVAESAKPVNWLLIGMIIAVVVIAGSLVFVLRYYRAATVRERSTSTIN